VKNEISLTNNFIGINIDHIVSSSFE